MVVKRARPRRKVNPRAGRPVPGGPARPEPGMGPRSVPGKPAPGRRNIPIDGPRPPVNAYPLGGVGPAIQSGPRPNLISPTDMHILGTTVTDVSKKKKRPGPGYRI